MVQYNTPGVYIEEINSLPPAIAQVNTAIPVFIGYTGAPTASGLHGTATRITSWMEYLGKFGQCAPTKLKVNVNERRTTSGKTVSLVVTNVETAKVNPALYLYYSVQLYFANGGGPCYILSTGNDVDALYTGVATTNEQKYGVINKAHFLGGTVTGVGTTPPSKKFRPVFEILEEFDEPTLIVIPDALAFKGLDSVDTKDIYNAALAHCAKMQDRFTIMDVPRSAPALWDYFIPNPMAYANSDLVQNNDYVDKHYRTGVGASSNELTYGAAYFPYVKSSLGFVANDADITIVTYDIKDLENATVTPVDSLNGKTLADSVGATPSPINKKYNAVYKAVKNFVSSLYLTLPPSGGVAGIYAATDRARGVWKAPANVGMTRVIAPAIAISNDLNDSLNVDSTGKSVNAIRSFTGRGTIVWGARTLDANNLNWRFVNVRRTVMVIEESVKKALEGFVFEPNTANTWTKVKAMIENYLTLIWRQGGLAGAKAEDAFEVNIGLNSTMSAEEIAMGIMTVEIVLVPTRPAEVIVIRVSQKLQES
jgi:uncharacterized protein